MSNLSSIASPIIITMVIIIYVLITSSRDKDKEIKKLKKDLIWQKRVRAFSGSTPEIPEITEFKKYVQEKMITLELRGEELNKEFFKKFDKKDFYLNAINDYSKEKNKEREELINKIMKVREEMEQLDKFYNERIDEIIDSHF